jgi:hypothetical protein
MYTRQTILQDSATHRIRKLSSYLSIFLKHVTAWLAYNTVAVFLVPDSGVKPAMASGCRTGPPSYIGWWAVRQPTLNSRLHPQSGTKNWASVHNIILLIPFLAQQQTTS